MMKRVIEWHSVNESAPTKSGAVLVLHFTVMPAVWDDEAHRFLVWGSYNKPLDFDVMHWAYFPKPPLEWKGYSVKGDAK